MSASFKHIRHIFFDLDRTLWDFDKNSAAALDDIYEALNLRERGIGCKEQFKLHYVRFNDYCWNEYRNNKMPKHFLRHQRFFLTLQQFGIEDRGFSKKIGEEYVERSPSKTALIQGTHEVLSHLAGQFHLHVITNGFQEVQHLKMKNTGIDHYFRHIITSERAGKRKPDPKIFHYALAVAEAKAGESVMIGDDLAIDVRGAESVGMSAIWFAPGHKNEDETVFAIDQLERINEYF